MSLFFIITGSIYSLVILGFAVTSVAEREKRAAAVALLMTAGFAVGWAATGHLFPGVSSSIAAVLWVVTAATVSFLLLPLGRSRPLAIDESNTSRVDERDIMFSRARLEEGSPEFETYYGALRPELAETDAAIRVLPNLGRPGGRYFVEEDAVYFESVFEYIEQINHLGDITSPAQDPPLGLSPQEATKRIKAFGRQLGALDVGVTGLRPHHLYSHVGRGRGRWGEEITLDHRFAIALTVEMDQRLIRNAPGMPAIAESAMQYLKSAAIAATLAQFCSRLGYRARAHVDGNYRVLATAVAHDAGLGELGRLGLLITPSHGPRVRLAVVTTDLPLVEDSRVNFGVQHFCRFCLKCAVNCPGRAISKAGKENVRGMEKWQSSQEDCYRYWRRAGTDCGLCIAVCPYSKPATFYHHIIRFLCARNAPARRLALLLDDIFYGKRPRHSDLPGWFSPEDRNAACPD